jgi:DNA-binding transcriptional LysR family regulator
MSSKAAALPQRRGSWSTTPNWRFALPSTRWGIGYTIEALAEPFLRSGQLVQVLEDWSPALDGLYLFHTGHRQVPRALRGLIEARACEHGGERRCPRRRCGHRWAGAGARPEDTTPLTMPSVQ